MSVKIRLKRAGSKGRPFYRVVVTDSRKARDSRSIEDLGYYNPLEEPVVVNVDRDRVAYWTEQGALASETVRAILKKENSTHPVRRKTVDFAEPVPEPTKSKKDKEKQTKGKAKADKADKPEKKAEAPKGGAATATAEAPEAAGEKPKAEEPKAEEAKADEPQKKAEAAEEPKAEEASGRPEGDDKKDESK